MKAEEVLRLMEKHELESNRRLERLDMRLWGIAILIIGAAVVERVF